MNVATTIIPKSDQLNFEDLITGPRTVRITGVSPGSTEQPLAVHYEGEEGRPYKPSKTMRRLMVGMWGSESDDWVGQSMTLYGDPNVKFGGQAVGGIKISHATGIEREFVAVLSVTKGKREPFKVQPLKVEAPAVEKPVDVAFLEEIGAKRAAEGMDALKSWYGKLSKAEKAAVKPTLDAKWKPMAAAADEEGSQ